MDRQKRKKCTYFVGEHCQLCYATWAVVQSCETDAVQPTILCHSWLHHIPHSDQEGMALSQLRGLHCHGLNPSNLQKSQVTELSTVPITYCNQERVETVIYNLLLPHMKTSYCASSYFCF